MNRILKFFVCLAVLVTASSASYAQTKITHFGVKVGANFSALNYEGYKDNMGYQAGIAVQVDLPAWFSVQPDILFHIKGAQDVENGRNQGLGYIEMPINLQWGPRFYDDNIRVFIQGGPYFGYAVSKDIKGKETQTFGSEQKTRQDFDWSNVNRFECGAGVGLGIKLFAFQLSAEYTWNFGSIKSASAVKDFPSLFNEGNFSGFQVNLAILF